MELEKTDEILQDDGSFNEIVDAGKGAESSEDWIHRL